MRRDITTAEDEAPPTAPIMTPARVAELEQDDADTLAELAVIRQQELS